MNAHRRSHTADNPILGNKGYKYKNVIVLLVSDKIQVGTSILRAKNLNNKSDTRVGKVISRTMT